jgi:ribosome-associated protein
VARAAAGEVPAWPASQHAIGAAVRSEAWAATAASSSNVAIVSASGTSVPSSSANEAIHPSALWVSSLGTARTYRGGMSDGPANLRVSSSLAIPVAELSWRFSRSGGPGGQHANTADTRVEVRFDVAGSPSLGPRQRARLLERFGPEVRAMAADERSQARNRELALRRLAERLSEGLRVDAPRRATRPTKASVERRLTGKRRQADRKAARRRPDAEH